MYIHENFITVLTDDMPCIQMITTISDVEYRQCDKCVTEFTEFTELFYTASYYWLEFKVMFQWLNFP